MGHSYTVVNTTNLMRIGLRSLDIFTGGIVADVIASHAADAAEVVGHVVHKAADFLNK